MARVAKRLTARTVATAAAGMHADGDGLYLVVGESGSRRWTFIFQWQGKRAEMGLGRVAEVSLAEARDAVAAARRQVRDGINPIAVRKAHENAAGQEAAKPLTFGAFAEDLLGSIKAEFRNAKHRDQWAMTLSVARDKEGELLQTGYCLALRDLPLADIDTNAVLRALQPIWSTKAETASRVRGRIERVLDAAKARGLRSGENPARWRGHLSALLPKPRKLARGHHAAMPYGQVPDFVSRLRASSSMAALALEWTILAAARTGETIGAKVGEVDRKARVWTIPADRMKANREHRVPLTDRMIEILQIADRVRDDGNAYIFPGPGVRRPLSNMAMTMQMRRLKVEDVTVHGFRSAFRDWVGEETYFRQDLAEAALAHIVGDATERAYRRGDALEHRRKLMEAWGAYVDGRADDPSESSSDLAFSSDRNAALPAHA